MENRPRQLTGSLSVLNSNHKEFTGLAFHPT